METFFADTPAVGLVFLIQQSMPEWLKLTLLLSLTADLKSFSKYFPLLLELGGGVTLFFLQLCPVRHLLIHQVGDNMTVIKQKRFM